MSNMKNIRITTLADNCVFGKLRVLGEHGLSIFVEVDGHKILFDTGTGRTILGNAEAIGVDLKEAEFIVISHGHGDHIGGLEAVLSVTGPKTVYIGEDAFAPKALLNKNGEYICTKLKTREDYTALGAKIIERSQSIELLKNVWLIGPIPRNVIYEDPMSALRFRKIDSGYIPETFPEEQVLAINTAEGLVLILGCTHNGIENTVEEAMKISGAEKLHTIIGGLHLAGVSSRRLECVAEYLRRYGVKNVVSCHCTGQRELAIMYRCLGDICLFNRVGNCVELKV